MTQGGHMEKVACVLREDHKRLHSHSGSRSTEWVPEGSAFRGSHEAKGTELSISVFQRDLLQVT